MARKRRIEYAGAAYRVMVRGNQPELRRLKSRLEQVYESSSGGAEACLHSEFRDTRPNG
jgi:hypothetical protein